ncbi:MAG: hypothetical protein JWP52_2378, partial [Rhizobacter sp.]|nr:hypothetical protein [Rhizobacter sp.]
TIQAGPDGGWHFSLTPEQAAAVYGEGGSLTVIATDADGHIDQRTGDFDMLLPGYANEAIGGGEEIGGPADFQTDPVGVGSVIDPVPADGEIMEVSGGSGEPETGSLLAGAPDAANTAFGEPLDIFGPAAPNASVELKFSNGYSETIQAGPDGGWRYALTPELVKAVYDEGGSLTVTATDPSGNIDQRTGDFDMLPVGYSNEALAGGEETGRPATEPAQTLLVDESKMPIITAGILETFTDATATYLFDLKNMDAPVVTQETWYFPATGGPLWTAITPENAPAALI